MSVQISSVQNWRIKNVIKLRRRRHRDRERLMLVEGVREAGLALERGLIPTESYVCPFVSDAESSLVLTSTLAELERQQKTQLFEVTPEIFSKIAYRGESGGVLLVLPYMQHSLANLQLGRPPFVAVVEDVEKPGNLGAILRSADGAGVDAIIICRSDPRGAGTDIHNPNVIRASLGTLFTLPVAVASTDEAIDWLQTEEIQTVAASPSATVDFTNVAYTEGVALVMGSEARGLSDRWLTAADKRVMIPMHGEVDSLNLAVSTALMLYEVVRQRTSPNIN